jgi:subtilisin-like proprotein convertase family protein
MRSLSGTTALMALTALLVGCGGGGTGSPAQSVSVTCDSGNLWAAQPSRNGTRIPDNSSTGITVTWDNQNCSIQSLTAATLDVCLDHDQPTELVWTMTRPSTGTSLTISAPNDWNSTGTSCDSGQGKLQRIDLLQSVLGVGSTQGTWALRVSDATSGNEGTLIQWRVNLQGLR